MKILANLPDISEEEWLKLRKNYIGASDAAAACGQSRWKSPLALYVEKTDPAVISRDSDAMWWGRQLEPLVRHRLPHTYEQETGYSIEVEPWPVMLVSDEYPWMSYSPDGRLPTEGYITGEGLLGPIGLEIKTTTGYHKDEWAENSLPTEYYYQAQHALIVTGYNWIMVAVLIDKTLEWRFVSRNAELMEEIVTVERRLWERISSYVPPDPMVGQDLKSISKVYPDESGETIELPDLSATAERLLILKQEIKLMEEEADLLTAKIKASMKGAKRAILGDRTATWSRFTRRWLDSKSLKKDRPDLHREYLRSAPTGRFVIK